MQRTRTQQIKEAFQRLQDAAPDERARMLADEPDGASSPLQLAASMLAKAERLPADFLEPSVDVAQAADRARSLSAQFVEATLPGDAGFAGDAIPGQRVGRYTLIRPLGEGGFGVVWEAEQTEPIHRLVAVKLVKPGMDTRQVIGRFAAERQSLAVMDHPSITKVLDAGSTDDGRPYFVMELVIGVPILERCRSRGVPTDSVLRLFEMVCRAIHHAHRRGIVHRDIKPSNILVTECDGEPTPRIIDFGIAKALAPGAHVDGKLTQQRQLVGTPSYMAPEQIDSRRGPVDERSDIYSLGVLLYELLTGATPRDADPDPYQDLEAIARRLDDPLPAKRRLSRLTGLPLDLDWITLKCLEVDRTRRYASALELAEDVRRFLGGEPVLAAPPSLGYRARKFCQRNRVLVGAAVGLFVTILLVGTAGFFWTNGKNRELDASNAELRARNEAYVREKAIAEKALEDVERLSDAHLLASLIARAEEDLWPAVPDKIPQMQSWIREAEELAARLEMHRSELRSVRSRALPDGTLGVPTLRRAPAQTNDPVRFDEGREFSRIAVEQVSTPADGSVERAPSFATTKDAWLHWLLESLVRQLDEFCAPESGSLASVRRRLEFASGLRDRSVDSYRDAWRESIAEILHGETYPGLREAGFEPHLGLVPLGRDPGSGLLEFLDLASHVGPIPERAADGGLQLSDDCGIVLVLIPGGSFAMGAQSEDEAAPNFDPMASANEGPVHDAQVEAFFLGKFEMTQAQWTRLAEGANPSYFYAGVYASGQRITRRHPVEQVSWSEGARVLRRAGLRYPTEAQWEYATRAGTSTSHFFGGDGPSLTSFANFADASAKHVTTRISNFDDGFPYTAPVGSFAANPFGLHDVYGNVAEWCSDVFLPHYDAARPLDEPLPKVSLRDSRRRLARGGAFNLLPDHTRSARRHAVRGDSILPSLGLRACREVTRGN